MHRHERCSLYSTVCGCLGFHSLSLKAFHSLSAVKDLIEFSPTFTNTMPSRVQVSATLLSRLIRLASHAIVDRTLVKSSLTKILVPFSLRAFLMTATLVLCVVNLTITSRGVSCVSLFQPTRCDRTKSCFVSWTSSCFAATYLTRPSVSLFGASGIPRMRKVFRLEYCSRSSVFSSRTVTLTLSSRISASFFAIMLPKDFVSVCARPRSI